MKNCSRKEFETIIINEIYKKLIGEKIYIDGVKVGEIKEFKSPTNNKCKIDIQFIDGCPYDFFGYSINQTDSGTFIVGDIEIN